MEQMEPIDELKIILREDDIPFFTDEQLNYYLSKNNNIVNDTAYRCLLLKAENTSMAVSGMNTNDTSAYFRRIANMYKPNNSGILKGDY